MKVQDLFYSNVSLEIVMILVFLGSKDSSELFKIQEKMQLNDLPLKDYYANKIYFVLILREISIFVFKTSGCV